jgi:hypothetical protein
MLGTAISQIHLKVGILMAQWFAVVSHLKKLCNNIIVGGIDRAILIAQFIKSQLVALKLNIELCLVQLINQVLLMKIDHMIVLLNLGAHGQQRLTIARQIPQRVYQVLRRGR